MPAGAAEVLEADLKGEQRGNNTSQEGLAAPSALPQPALRISKGRVEPGAPASAPCPLSSAQRGQRATPSESLLIPTQHRQEEALPGPCRRKGQAEHCTLGTWSLPGTGRSEPAPKAGSQHKTETGQAQQDHPEQPQRDTGPCRSGCPQQRHPSPTHSALQPPLLLSPF